EDALGLLQRSQVVRPQGPPQGVVLDIEAIDLARVSWEEIVLAVPGRQLLQRRRDLVLAWRVEQPLDEAEVVSRPEHRTQCAQPSLDRRLSAIPSPQVDDIFQDGAPSG